MRLDSFVIDDQHACSLTSVQQCEWSFQNAVTVLSHSPLHQTEAPSLVSHRYPYDQDTMLSQNLSSLSSMNPLSSHFVLPCRHPLLLLQPLWLCRFSDPWCHRVSVYSVPSNYCVPPSLLQFSSVAQSCQTLCDPIDCSMPGLPVHHQLPEFTQTHVCRRVSDAIQASHPLSSPSPPALNLLQHQGLFQWVSSSYQVAKVLLKFQLQHQSFQWTPRTDLL